MNENRAGLGYQDFETVRTQQIFYIIMYTDNSGEGII